MNSLFSDQPIEDDNKDFLAEYVGEGKKYKTPQDIAKAYYHADKTIEVFKREKDQYRQENEELRNELNQRAKLQDMIDQLSKAQPPASSDNTPAKEEPVKPVVTLEEYEKIVEQKLSAHETQKRQTENFNTVQDELKKRYGSRYQDVLEKQMVELGINKDFVDFNAKNNPRALLKMLGEASTQETFQAPPRSTKSPFSMKKEDKRTWSWYQNLRRTDPKTYRDPKTSVQMIKDYETLGKDFEDGDFEQGYL